MKKEDWEKAKSRLRAPLGQVDLLCDGYSVTLVNECISMFRNGIAVYASDNILQGAGINSESQYWAQCASDASVRFILAYY